MYYLFVKTQEFMAYKYILNLNLNYMFLYYYIVACVSIITIGFNIFESYFSYISHILTFP